MEPIFAATPAVAGMLADDVPEGERNTLLSRRFPGGLLKVVASRAPRNLRRHTARALPVDEANRASSRSVDASLPHGPNELRDDLGAAATE